MDLIPAEILMGKEADFDARRDRLPGHYNVALLDDPLGGQALKFYLLLTEMPELLADQRLSAEQRFWSRYYWFLRYVKVREAAAGPDAGLEQQAFQILEPPPPGCCPDWSMVEQVQAAVARDVAAPRRADARH